MLSKFLSFLKLIFLFCLFTCFDNCLAQNYDAELINRNTIIDISDGKLVQLEFVEIRINNRNGDKYAEISIPFNKLKKVSDIEASITDNKGQVVRKLKKSDIIERSANSDISFFDDTYIKEFSLRHHTYPYTLKYSYCTSESQFLFAAYWVPVIDTDIPTLNATLKLSTKAGYKINYRTNLTDMCKTDSIPGQIIYMWSASYPKPIKDEGWAPPKEQFVPSVQIVPEKFRYELEGTCKTWKDFGNWELNLLKELDDLPALEKAKIQTIVKDLTGDKEKIRDLFHYLQESTRYINVSIKTGGMKPYPASYVAEKKYGDCKALSNYFKSCLSVTGIGAYYTSINAGSEIGKFDSSFPSQQFNHIILFVPLEKDTLWLDCTSDLAFGYLGTFTQNRPAFVSMTDSSKLLMTPALGFDDVLENRNIRIEIISESLTKADFNDTYKGEKYELYSYVLSSLSETQRKQYIPKVIQPGFQLENYSLTIPERDKPEISLKYTSTSDKVLKVYGNESLVKIIPAINTFLEDPKNRTLPIQIDYPIHRIDSCVYIIPGFYKISDVPENIRMKTPYGEYTANFTIKGHTVLVDKQLKINSGSYSLAEYQKFYSFIKDILESENSTYITLTKS